MNSKVKMLVVGVVVLVSLAGDRTTQVYHYTNDEVNVHGVYSMYAGDTMINDSDAYWLNCDVEIESVESAVVVNGLPHYVSEQNIATWHVESFFWPHGQTMSLEMTMGLCGATLQPDYVTRSTVYRTYIPFVKGE